MADLPLFRSVALMIAGVVKSESGLIELLLELRYRDSTTVIFNSEAIIG